MALSEAQGQDIGMHRPACTEMVTRPLPQWLYNLKGIPQHNPKDDKSQVFEHISERSRDGRIEVCSPSSVV